MIDLTKLDPWLLYEFGRQAAAAFPNGVTLDVRNYEWGTAYWWTTRVGPIKPGNYVLGTDEDIIEALRKLQAAVTAETEKQAAETISSE